MAAVTLINADPNVAIGFRERSHPSIDVDPVSGQVFVVYATYIDSSPYSDADVMIASSPSGGAGPWISPVRVNQDVGTTVQILPWIDIGNSRLHVVFSSRAAGGTNWDTRVAYGAVAAAPTFTEIVVSSEVTAPGTRFIGDYHGTFLGSDDVVHPAWGDGRTGVGGTTDASTARVDFSPAAAVARSPLTPTQNVGLPHAFTATVTGAHGEVETFVPVSFSDLGGGFPSPSGASTVTDSAGQAGFSYTNAVPGLDTLHVFADLDEDDIEDPGEGVETEVSWNGAPFAEAGGPYPVGEGAGVELDRSGSTDPNGDILSFEWDLDNDGTFETSGETPMFSATGLDGPSTHTVVLRVCDPFALCDTDTAEVEVTNVAPTANAGPDQTVFRFDTVNLTGTWTDPAGALDDPYAWSWDLDGDGTPDSSGSASYGGTIAETTSFALEGTYSLAFTVADVDGGRGRF